jgi:D-sedoheptulose 7-phosphate isomerase
MDHIKNIIDQSVAVKEQLKEDENALAAIQAIAQACINAFRNRNKVLFCGNGGSAADAQHISAELSGRFYVDREPLYAEALHVNTSYLTAVANDYCYDEVFSRLVQAKGKKGDILIALSTSGNSANVINAIETARQLGMITVGLTGSSGGKMNGLSDHLIRVPSDNVARIQESHIMIGHILCEIIESTLFGR